MNDKVLTLLSKYGDRFKCKLCEGTGVIMNVDAFMSWYVTKCPHCKDTGGYDAEFYNAIDVLYQIKNHLKIDSPSHYEAAWHCINDFLSKLEDGE